MEDLYTLKFGTFWYILSSFHALKLSLCSNSLYKWITQTTYKFLHNNAKRFSQSKVSRCSWRLRTRKFHVRWNSIDLIDVTTVWNSRVIKDHCGDLIPSLIRSGDIVEGVYYYNHLSCDRVMVPLKEIVVSTPHGVSVTDSNKIEILAINVWRKSFLSS